MYVSGRKPDRTEIWAHKLKSKQKCHRRSDKDNWLRRVGQRHVRAQSVGQRNLAKPTQKGETQCSQVSSLSIENADAQGTALW